MIPIYKNLWVFKLINWIADLIELFWKLPDRNWVGFATPFIILIRKDLKSGEMERKIRHEKRHVFHWWFGVIAIAPLLILTEHRTGCIYSYQYLLGFPLLYLIELLRNDYHNNWFEIDARGAEDG